jgi:hypothetical protein
MVWAAEPDAERIEFNRDVRPIFLAHCTACHGGVKQAAELSLVYAEQVLPPGGWVVEPGDPDGSELLRRVMSDDPDERMPPAEHGPPLDEDEIARLRRWIEQGAQWQKHWAFETPRPQEPPPVSDPSWSTGDLDRFVLARLETEGIEPSPPDMPARWLRRVSLDLIGMPPTPEEVAVFVADVETCGEAAYASAVDRLLAAPQFGERWASVWLDLVRYADSKGLGQDGRRTIWKYRDWVIESLNHDLPYDEFTIKQIAGDLLPEATLGDLIATACHRLTQTNEEGGTDDEEFRIAAVLDRVSTTWQTWQGVSIGCVQCHSHPYDPIRHEEFYESVAFFNNTADSDINDDSPHLQVPTDHNEYDRARQLDREIESVRDKIWQTEYALLDDATQWQPLKQLTASANRGVEVAVEQIDDETHDEHDEYHTVDTVAGGTVITLEAALPDGMDELTAIRLTVLPLDPEAGVRDSAWGFVVSHFEAELVVPGEDEPREVKLRHVVADEPDPHFPPRQSLNSQNSRGWAAYTRINYPRQASFVLDEPLGIPAGARLRVRLDHRVTAEGAFPLVARRGHLAVSDRPAWCRLLPSGKLRLASDELSQLRQQLLRLDRKRRLIESVPLPVLRERPAHLARPTHVFIRGLFLTKDKQVEPGVPESLPPLPEGVPRDRRALAAWLVCDENPLTARVAVNRIWAQLFGVGLVATEEDFGSSGDPPSHPALLDYLALRFQNEHAWSTKQLLSELVLSQTYRQSSRIRADLADRDPENRLLARGPRHRLPAEVVRDQALAISGLLSERMYGPPVHPPIPEGVWQPFQGDDPWPTPPPGDPDRYRRSIYTYRKRSIPYPMFATFDSPSREFCTPRRLRSNTPIQALTMLNDEAFVECAAALAERMTSHADELNAQLSHGFQLATCRLPSDEELAALAGLYSESNQNDTQSPMKIVASVLLNLDEVVTK